jgi:L-ascorbate 6-phosphate lactonase
MPEGTGPDAWLTEVERARVEAGTVALWYTGGAGYIVKAAGATLLIDPFVGPSNPPDWVRAIPPAFDIERIAALGRLDAVVLTHEHSDHTDTEALSRIACLTNAPVIGPASCIELASAAGVPEERCRLLAHDESLTLGDLRLTAVPMHDPGARGCNGYVLETGAVTVLHGADSLYFEGFLELGRRWSFDAVCLSVGANPPGRTIYMDEADVARAARDLGARRLIPHHFDLWQGLTLDPHRVAIAASWYCPEVVVTPALFRKRLTVEPQMGG